MLYKVKVSPGSKKREIIKKDKDRFEIRVKAKPERGLANKEVMETISAYFKVPISKVRLIKGNKSTNKIFEIIDY
ncbi:MAG: DUF167 domain-containing protein [Candidatus Nealsonbacteria bacterium]